MRSDDTTRGFGRAIAFWRSTLHGSLLACAGIAGLALTGCTTLPRFQPVGTRLGSLQAQGVCERMLQHREAMSSFRALTEATFTHGRESASFRYALVGQEPDKLRIDMLPLEGAFTLGIFVSDAGQVTLLNAQEKTFLQGEDESALLQRFFGISGLSREIIEGMVLGVLPSLRCSGVDVITTQDGVVVLDPASHTAWTVAGEDDPTVRKVTVLDDAQRISLSASRKEGVAKVALYDPVRATGEIVVTRLTPNPPIAPSLFAVKVPDSYHPAE